MNDDEQGRRTLVLRPLVRARSSNPRRGAESRLAEAVGLAEAIALTIAGSEIISLTKTKPSTLFGRGKVEEIKGLIKGLDVELTIIDGELSPVQQRNLEKAWSCKVIDRTGLILEIFGARAQTREGRLQVELAALGYQRSRLVRSWTHLERQRGGHGFLGGPGESQIESDRRQIDDRITRIRREIETVVKTRTLHRKARQRVPYAIVALVGYTNAGKSTLFNRLTGAAVDAEDKLFATLDPTLRGVTLPSGRRIILSDTVGFISALPTMLVAAFRATLEEVLEADIIVHVRDIAHLDSLAQRDDVHGVLRELGLDEVVDGGTMIEAQNKIDLLNEEERGRLQNIAGRDDACILLSAASGEGCDELLNRLDARLAESMTILDLAIDFSDGATLAWLYRHGEVINRVDHETHCQLTVGLNKDDASRFKARQASE